MLPQKDLLKNHSFPQIDWKLFGSKHTHLLHQFHSEFAQRECKLPFISMGIEERVKGSVNDRMITKSIVVKISIALQLLTPFQTWQRMHSFCASRQ